MAWPTSLQVALKEWATVCHALETGRQILLLRKGGVQDTGGTFQLQNREFLLFPTYVHQNLNMLKPEAQADYQPVATEPAQVKISAAGVVSDIVAIKSRAVDALDDEHIWAPPQIDMRFNYKPEKPLYLVVVRTYRLHEPVVIENTVAYGGCVSWVPLEQAIATGEALPVLDDVKHEFRRNAILQKIAATTTP